jgi:WhiB family redox-sensing transcriptional regulator
MWLSVQMAGALPGELTHCTCRYLLTSRVIVKSFTSQNDKTDDDAGTQESQRDRRGASTMDWRHHAACRDEDPELFFPVGTSGPALLQITEAKTVCRRCPVNAECLNWALGSGQDAGVWGGMSEDERRALKRRNARTGARNGV